MASELKPVAMPLRPLLGLLLTSTAFLGCGKSDLDVEFSIRKESRPVSIVRSAGAIWVATRFSGVFGTDISSGRPAGDPYELELTGSQRRTHWIAAFRDHLWICSDAGLIRYSPEKKKIVSVWTKKDGLAADSVRCVEESGGAIWAGTIRGASRMDPHGKWTSYGEAQGLPSAHVYRLFIGRDAVWASCIRGGLAAWKPEQGRWRTISAERGLGNSYIYAISEGAAGLWLGTAGGVNLYSPSKKSWDEAVCSDGYTDYCVYALAEIGEDLWFATNYGLHRRNLKTGRQRIYGAADGLPSAETTALLAEPGRLWVGSAAGLTLLNIPEL